MTNNAKKSVIAENEAIIKESFKNVSDDKLKANLKDVNIESLLKQSTGERGKNVWKQTFKDKYSHKGTTARNKIRKEQSKLSANLVTAVYNSDNIEKHSKLLMDFYKDGLIDLNIFSSREQSGQEFKIISSAHKILKDKE